MSKLIDANALIDKLNVMISEDILYHTQIPYALIRELISEQPTIDAVPVRRGRWIPTEYDSFANGAPVWDKWECSECGHEHNGEEDTLTALCPDCGVRMDATDTNVGGKGLRIARKSIENALTVNRWIPCSERLPDDRKCVLVTDGENIEITFFDGSDWEMHDMYGNHYELYGSITHWMPLPSTEGLT